MGWYELKERKSSNHGMKEKLMEIKALLCELCEELEMEESYGERNYGERRGYKITEDDDYGERMSRRRY